VNSWIHISLADNSSVGLHLRWAFEWRFRSLEIVITIKYAADTDRV